MRDSLGWGILGTGKIARLVAPAIAASRSGRLAAVASRSPGRARRFAADFGVPTSYGDYESLLSDPSVDVVYVATPHPTHERWTRRAVESGKHVLCEKPLAVTHAGAHAMVEAARGNNVFLMEAFAYRCHPQTDAILRVVHEGSIGSVLVVDAVFGYDAGPHPMNYLFDWTLAGGSILDVGCYTTSMAHLLARAQNGSVVEPEAVTGSGLVGDEDGVDHLALATIDFGGLLARVACSVVANLESSLRVYGSDGWLWIQDPWLPGREGERSSLTLHRGDAGARDIVIEPPGALYVVEVDAVGSAIRRGSLNPDEMPWEESLANMATLDRWRKAIGLRFAEDDHSAVATAARKDER